MGLCNIEKCHFCPASWLHCVVWCPFGPLPPPAVTLRTQLVRIQLGREKKEKKKRGSIAPSATPNCPSSVSVWAMTLCNTSSPMSTHTSTSIHTHTQSHLPAVLMHCPWTMCTLAKTFKSCRAKHTKWPQRLFLRLFLVVSPIFRSCALILGPFTFSWRIFASIFSHFVNRFCCFSSFLGGRIASILDCLTQTYQNLSSCV